ncbi:MAG: hypothetical protein AAGB06_05790 [Verrucomicrobiota bacterium]
MRPLLATLIAIAAFPMAMVLLFLGSAIPGQQSSVAPARLEFLGNQGPSLVDVAEDLLTRGKLGPARTLALTSDHPKSKPLLEQINHRIVENPFLSVSGGQDPYFAELAKIVEREEQAIPKRASAANFIVFEPARRTLWAMLDYSDNDWVRRTLAGRGITGLPHLPPVDSAAGAPMETALLVVALLTQSESIPSQLSREITDWIERALERDVSVLSNLDRALIDTLGLAQRTDWETLKAIFAHAESWEGISWLSAAVRAPDSLTSSNVTVISAWLESDTSEALKAYLQEFSESGWEDIAKSLKFGPISLNLLISENKPIYEAPAWLSGIYPFASKFIEAKALTLTHGEVSTLSTLRFSLFALSGLVIAAALIEFLRQADQVEIPVSKAILASGTTAAVFTIISWASTEPSLLESTQPSIPEIRFNAGPGELMGSLKASNMNPGPIDQVTLLVLGVFLLIQIIIYIVCLVRVSDINKQPVSPSLKIALLENEDSLFDTGLYVGLGGTVLSLILVTLGIVEASIMAAYASTLFGIIFVAALKIFHVRPLRRSLILQRERPL